MNVNLYPIEVDGGAIYQIAALSCENAKDYCNARFGKDAKLYSLDLDDTGSSEVDFITPEALLFLAGKNA